MALTERACAAEPQSGILDMLEAGRLTGSGVRSADALSASVRDPQLSVAACPRIQLNLLNQRLGLNAGAFAVSATTRPLREPEYGAQCTRHRNPKQALLGDQPDRLDEATQRLPRLLCVIHFYQPGKLGDPLAKVVVSPGRCGWSDHAANRPPPLR